MGTACFVEAVGEILASCEVSVARGLERYVGRHLMFEVHAQDNKTFKSRDNTMFVSTIDMFGRYLEKHPTLIPYFPLSILKNMKRIRKKCKKRSLNVIYLTRHHKLTCAGCKSKVVGNQCESRSCACSTRFYHKSCYTVLKCDVCGM